MSARERVTSPAGRTHARYCYTTPPRSLQFQNATHTTEKPTMNRNVSLSRSQQKKARSECEGRHLVPRCKRETLICGHKPPTQAKAGARGGTEKKQNRGKGRDPREEVKKKYEEGEEAKRHWKAARYPLPILCIDTAAVCTRQRASENPNNAHAPICADTRPSLHKRIQETLRAMYSLAECQGLLVPRAVGQSGSNR